VCSRIFAAAGEDDGAVHGERESQEGRRPTAPLRQLQLVKCRRAIVLAGGGPAFCRYMFSLFPDIASNVAVIVMTPVVLSTIFIFLSGSRSNSLPVRASCRCLSGRAGELMFDMMRCHDCCSILSFGYFPFALFLKKWRWHTGQVCIVSIHNARVSMALL
jgi:hypothetical protein